MFELGRFGYEAAAYNGFVAPAFANLEARYIHQHKHKERHTQTEKPCEYSLVSSLIAHITAVPGDVDKLRPLRPRPKRIFDLLNQVPVLYWLS